MGDAVGSGCSRNKKTDFDSPRPVCIFLAMVPSSKIAIVHDWLTGMRGGEKVLEILCELYPEATLFTLVHKKGSCSPAIERMKIRTSYLQSLPGGLSHYRHYLPLYPAAAKSLNLAGFDLVISSSHAAAKAVTIPPGVPHICYCYTPMRYIWDQYDQYFGAGRASLPIRLAMRGIRGYLREWDVRTAKRVDHFVAISHCIEERIQRIYGRSSTVIYPPVETARFKASEHDEGYYLVFSALVPYKRVDLAVEAFNRLGKKLIVAGTGAELEKLRAMAGPTIAFKGWVEDADLPNLYAGCKALIFPGVEDFGIVPVEAMASGKPVIAFGEGGALETVSEGVTGTFFSEQSAQSLADAVLRLETMHFDPDVIRKHTLSFDREIFRDSIRRFIEEHSIRESRISNLRSVMGKFG